MRGRRTPPFQGLHHRRQLAMDRSREPARRRAAAVCEATGLAAAEGRAAKGVAGAVMDLGVAVGRAPAAAEKGGVAAPSPAAAVPVVVRAAAVAAAIPAHHHRPDPITWWGRSCFVDLPLPNRES